MCVESFQLVNLMALLGGKFPRQLIAIHYIQTDYLYVRCFYCCVLTAKWIYYHLKCVIRISWVLLNKIDFRCSKVQPSTAQHSQVQYIVQCKNNKTICKSCFVFNIKCLFLSICIGCEFCFWQETYLTFFLKPNNWIFFS